MRSILHGILGYFDDTVRDLYCLLEGSTEELHRRLGSLRYPKEALTIKGFFFVGNPNIYFGLSDNRPNFLLAWTTGS